MVSQSLRIAQTGLGFAQKTIDTIAGNVANANTPAFKEQIVLAADLPYQTSSRAGTTDATGNQEIPVDVQYTLGVKVQGISKNFSQGPLVPTDDKLSFAISGDGFFEVTLPDGDNAYTRDGNFTLNSEGLLVTAAGLEVNPGVTIPDNANNIVVNKDGTITADLPDEPAAELGRFVLFRFTNDVGLEAIGNNMYLPTDASGDAQEGNPTEDGYGEIVQSHFEGSNVNTVKNVADLMAAQHLYEFNSNVLKISDEVGKRIANVNS